MKISRWQVFKIDSDHTRVVCKKCEASFDYIKAEAFTPRKCPVCGAFMIGKKCWFPPKE